MATTNRFTPHLHVHFAPLPDETEYSGLMLVYGPERVTFVTKKEVAEKQELMLSVCLVEEHTSQCSPRQPAKVLRVERKEHLFRVTAEYEKKLTGEHPERRSLGRYDVDLPATCTIQPGNMTFDCTLKNISRNGLGLLSERRVSEGQTLHIQAETPMQAGRPSANLQADVKVERVRHLGDGQYDVGTRFVRAEVVREEHGQAHETQ